MTNREYMENRINDADIIYMDTASFMGEGLNLFIGKGQPILLENNKKITVSRSVSFELMRHLNSDNEQKRLVAKNALSVIFDNQELFFVEDTVMSEEEIAKAFADAELLAELTRNKSGYKQLLITNDKKLSSDAYDLNSLHSCKGKHISVCYINSFGEMNVCKCVTDKNKSNEREEPIEGIISLEEIGNTSSDADTVKNEEKKEWRIDWKSVAVGLGTSAYFYGTYKLVKKFLPYILQWRIFV